MQPAAPPDALFDAIIYPNQPMSRRQMRLVLCVVTIIAIMIGAGFAVVGAWPIAGFFGLDILLLVMAFRAVRKQAGRTERVRLDAEGLLVEADNGRGKRQRWLFEPYWVRVHIDDPPQRRSLVTLRSHGRMIRLGAFLTPNERLSFARSLQCALSRWR